MVLYRIPEAAMAELNALATNGVVDITSAAVMNSAFYRAIQTETNLDASQLSNLPPETLLLIARIAASSTVHTVYMSFNYLGSHGPATATALAASPTIHTVDMSCNDLGEHINIMNVRRCC